MTTTTTHDGGASEEVLPPTSGDVLRELRALRSRDGVTPAKVKTGGLRLQALAISRDELSRHGGANDELPAATVKALRCVVDSYKRPVSDTDGRGDARWFVLRHELNLTQEFGFDLRGRQGEAKRVLGFGDDTYAHRAKAIIENFAFDIVGLEESLCREPRAASVARSSADLFTARGRSSAHHLLPSAAEPYLWSG